MIKARFGEDFDQVVRRIFPFIARIRVQPDALTLIGAGVAGLAAIAFARDALLAAGLLLMVSGFFDLIDGVVARQQGVSSTAGAFFDSTIDRLSDLLIFAGILYGATVRADTTLALLTLWALTGSVMTSYTRASAEKRLSSLGIGFMERGERFGLLILGALTTFLQTALLLVAVGASITSVQRILAGRRLLHELEESGIDPTLSSDGADRVSEAPAHADSHVRSKGGGAA